MPSKRMNKANTKIPASNFYQALQVTTPEAQDGMEVSMSSDEEMATTSLSSCLEAACENVDLSSGATEPAPNATTTTSAKTERNRRKKENMKKRKAVESQKKAAKEKLFVKFGAMALDDTALPSSHTDDSKTPLATSTNINNSRSPPGGEGEADEQQTRNSSGKLAARLWEVKSAGSKGLGVFATQNIKKDTVIFQEAPLIIGASGTWVDKEAAFMVLSEEKQRDYMALHSYCTCQKTPCFETPFVKIWEINSFEVSIFREGRLAVYKIASRINHSCLPNVLRRYTSTGNIVIYSAEDINKGDELAHDYNNVGLLPTIVRRQYLRTKYGFFCHCRGCDCNKAAQASAVKRRMDLLDVPVKIGTSQILGERTADEVAAVEEAELWYQNLERYIEGRRPYLQVKTFVDHIKRENKKAQHSEEHEGEVKDWIRSHNKFNLSEAVIQKYISLIMMDTGLVMDDYLRQIKETQAKHPEWSSERINSLT